MTLLFEHITWREGRGARGTEAFEVGVRMCQWSEGRLTSNAVLVLADAFVEGDRVVSEAKPLRLEDQIVNRGVLGTLCHVRTFLACCSFKEQGVRYFGTTRRSFVFLAHDLSRGVHCF